VEALMKIFVSYSWINEKPDSNVLQFVANLRSNGYNAICDVIITQQETAIHFTEMMAEQLRTSDKVIVVLSKKYKQRADSFVGGVVSEYRYIIEDIKKEKQKYILVTFDKDRSIVTPDFLNGCEILVLDINDVMQDALLHKLNNTGSHQFPPVNPQKIKPQLKLVTDKLNFGGPHVGCYDIGIRFNGTDETLIKFKNSISNEIQAVSTYDESQNIIGFSLYNNEPKDINQIYVLIYEVIEKCKIQNVDFTHEIKLI